MRLGQAIFFGSAAALLTLAAPTLARNSNTPPPPPKAVEATAPSCQAYQQAADGSWTPLSCQEMGSKTPVQSRTATEGTAEESR